MFDKLFNSNVYNVKLYKTREEAVYHSLVLNEINGAIDINAIRKSDGSLKPMSFKDASVEDRKRVFDFLESKKES